MAALAPDQVLTYAGDVLGEKMPERVAVESCRGRSSDRICLVSRFVNLASGTPYLVTLGLLPFALLRGD